MTIGWKRRAEDEKIVFFGDQNDSNGIANEKRQVNLRINKKDERSKVGKLPT